MSEYQKIGIEICQRKIFTYKIMLGIFMAIFLIILIAGRFKVPSLILSGFLAVVILIVIIPLWMSDQRLLRSVQEEKPVITRVTHLGWEREGKRSVPVAYFQYNGKERYAINYNDKKDREVKEGDQICVWTNQKSYLMVKIK